MRTNTCDDGDGKKAPSECAELKGERFITHVDLSMVCMQKKLKRYKCLAIEWFFEKLE
jgi:hypothetical protein